MPSRNEKLFKFRVFSGINLIENSRTFDPTAWKKLQNLYAKSRGEIRIVPGSTLFASTVKVEVQADNPIEEAMKDTGDTVHEYPFDPGKHVNPNIEIDLNEWLGDITTVDKVRTGPVYALAAASNGDPGGAFARLTSPVTLYEE